MDNTNEILAKKRAWRNSERRKQDRRIKDGSPEDRKNTADALRAGKHKLYCSCSICELQDAERRANFSGFMLMGCIALAVIMLLLLGTKAHAYTHEEAILAVIGEAEGEPQQGKDAVACAIHNRGSLKGVYGLHASRVINHLYSTNTFADAVLAVDRSSNEAYCQELIHGASFWEGTSFKTPYWARNMKVTAIIGHQKFFRKD